MVSFCLNMFSLERSGAVSYKMDPHQYPMVTFFNDSNEDEDQGFLAIEQFVTDVVDFSSQYGSDISITYTAYNLAGKPSKYPDYGDFPQAFVMRTYGNWWQEAPSRREIFMPQNLGKIVSQDYIDLRFEQAVFPVTISIYETFNPGSVVRIWAGWKRANGNCCGRANRSLRSHGPDILTAAETYQRSYQPNPSRIRPLYP
ncbi:hypothetical protein LSTR_LSTR013766 [Laodelphax striatellus]|uniref:Uncharacterized protein n=1 Tax=Laodelphax striatellus TaxID=195883 RepID=A0A482WGN0_LAOST|nr:hypothetical protein LSTR_LSTR013766 [Laodelphax striatellus]